MKVIVIPILIDERRTIPKRLVKRLKDLEIRGQVETIKTILSLRSTRIQRRLLDTSGDFLLIKLLQQKKNHKKTLA